MSDRRRSQVIRGRVPARWRAARDAAGPAPDAWQVLAARGVPPHLIGDMLRHTDGRMAERVYGRRSRETVGRQVAAITRRVAFSSDF